MEILRLDEERLRDFQELYLEFFKELRGKQGWSPHAEAEYRAEATYYFKRGDIIFLALENGEAAGFIRVRAGMEVSGWKSSS